MPLNLFYTMVQKRQKWPKTQIKGGPALTKTLLSKCKLFRKSDSFSQTFYSWAGLSVIRGSVG